jgi:hypothetical protein
MTQMWREWAVRWIWRWLGLVLCSTLGSAAAFAAPGQVIGTIDGIAYDGDQAFIIGWACQQGRSESISINVYVDRSAYDTPRGTLALDNKADFDSEPAINQACQDHGNGKHRFLVELPSEVARKGEAGKLFVHGIRAVNGVENAVIAGSGTPLHRLDALTTPFITATPLKLVGSYRHLDGHPRVFTTEAELRDLATRINRAGSYSQRRFARLASQVKNDLVAPVDWDATYAGCDIDIYLRAYSIEARGGYASEVRSEERLRGALKVAAGKSAPAGAAIVASRLALYAALVKVGAQAPPDGPSGADAAALAKRILLAWGTHGFRDARGNILPLSAFQCDDKGNTRSNPTPTVGTDVALQFGRAIHYTVDAQDLLQFLGTLSAAETAQLNKFHLEMADLIRRSGNKGLGNPHPPCERFSNGTTAELTSLLAVARLVDDEARFKAALYGGDRTMPVLIPWVRFFDGAIYGGNDHPIGCYPNSGPDGLHSGGAFTTSVVAAGEIQDRYRALVLQTFGYPMGSLQGLFNIAEMLRIAGFDPYALRGTHQQSLEMAVQYYACYGKTPGFYKTVTADSARNCANHAQYEGKVVNAVEYNIVVGAYRFPQNGAITAEEAAAKDVALSGAGALDAPLFGRWRD